MVDGLSAWMDEPVDIPRVASGQKNRTHRLKALGNAIIPQIAQRIGIAIKETL
jgi:site-specific DNA-cytosine methylase